MVYGWICSIRLNIWYTTEYMVYGRIYVIRPYIWSKICRIYGYGRNAKKLLRSTPEANHSWYFICFSSNLLVIPCAIIQGVSWFVPILTQNKCMHQKSSDMVKVGWIRFCLFVDMGQYGYWSNFSTGVNEQNRSMAEYMSRFFEGLKLIFQEYCC